MSLGPIYGIKSNVRRLIAPVLLSNISPAAQIKTGFSFAAIKRYASGNWEPPDRSLWLSGMMTLKPSARLCAGPELHAWRYSGQHEPSCSDRLPPMNKWWTVCATVDDWNSSTTDVLLLSSLPYFNSCEVQLTHTISLKQDHKFTYQYRSVCFMQVEYCCM